MLFLITSIDYRNPLQFFHRNERLTFCSPRLSINIHWKIERTLIDLFLQLNSTVRNSLILRDNIFFRINTQEKLKGQDLIKYHCSNNSNIFFRSVILVIAISSTGHCCAKRNHYPYQNNLLLNNSYLAPVIIHTIDQ